MMNTQNKEDIPTRNLKKKKKKQKHPKLETDDFPRGTKKTNKKNKKQRNIEKFSNYPTDLTSRRKQNRRKYQARGIFFSSKTPTISFNTFSLPNLQNKVTFLTFTHPTSILVPVATWFITPTTSVNHQQLLGISEDQKKKKKNHTTPLNYTATSVCHLLGSSIFSPQNDILFKNKKYLEVHTHKKS